MPLIGLEINVSEPLLRPALVEELRGSDEPLLVLDTCQRLECFGFTEPSLSDATATAYWSEKEAFERLVRIAAGLESRILGELEVLGQVRNAYKAFCEKHEAGTTRLDRILQDAIALARKARRESGIDKTMTSLSGLAARELLQKIPEGAPLAVIGSGSIAASAARYLGKRGKSPIRVMSRCPEKAASLAMKIGGFGSSLDDVDHLLEDVAGLITATAAPHPVLFAHHVTKALEPLVIIDLGEPPDCSDEFKSLDKVEYIDLLEVETRAQLNTEERRLNAKKASRIIRDGVSAWTRRN